VGLTVTLPLILVLLDPVRREQLRRSIVRRESLLQAAATVAILWFVLRGPPSGAGEVLLPPLPAGGVIAARHGLAGAALAIGVVQAGIAIEVHGGPYESLTVFELQAEVIALAVTGLFLGMTVDERRRLGRNCAVAAPGRRGADGARRSPTSSTSPHRPHELRRLGPADRLG